MVVVVAPSKQGGGCWLCAGSCVLLTPFLSVKACLCFWLARWLGSAAVGLLHPDRGGVRSSVELLWVGSVLRHARAA